MDFPNTRDRHLVYENPYQKVYRVIADFGRYEKEYFVTETGERSGLMANMAGLIFLVNQFRLLINGYSWEISGGRNG